MERKGRGLGSYLRSTAGVQIILNLVLHSLFPANPDVLPKCESKCSSFSFWPTMPADAPTVSLLIISNWAHWWHTTALPSDEQHLYFAASERDIILAAIKKNGRPRWNMNQHLAPCIVGVRVSEYVVSYGVHRIRIFDKSLWRSHQSGIYLNISHICLLLGTFLWQKKHSSWDWWVGIVFVRCISYFSATWTHNC